MFDDEISEEKSFYWKSKDNMKVFMLSVENLRIMKPKPQKCWLREGDEDQRKCEISEMFWENDEKNLFKFQDFSGRVFFFQ